MSPADRRARVDRDDPVLAIVAQCRLLKIARSTLYYRPAPVDPDDLAVMRRMDELYLASPFYGSRRMVAVLRREGLVINRKRVRRLMRVTLHQGVWLGDRGAPGHRRMALVLQRGAAASGAGLPDAAYGFRQGSL